MFYDELIGLGNCWYLFEWFDEFKKCRLVMGGEIVVFYIDLDCFKYINDMMGYVVGDYVLLEVFGCIFCEFVLEDVVVCIGGDEFVVLVYVVVDSECLE